MHHGLKADMILASLLRNIEFVPEALVRFPEPSAGRGVVRRVDPRRR